MALRIGVTGHREQSLQRQGARDSELRATIRYVLSQIHDKTVTIFLQNRDAYDGMKPTFRVISPLAEGSDRLVAEEAMASGLGFELQSPLPFYQEEYEKDFRSAESRRRFAELLKQADKVFELDGSRSSEDRAYEAVGRVVLRQSDILLAIWDGQPPRGRGGTGQIVKEALARKIPVIWIYASSPLLASLVEQLSEDGTPTSCKGLNELFTPKETQPKVGRLSSWLRALWARQQPEQSAPVEILDARLREILALPSKKELKTLTTFLTERQRHRRIAILYRFFCKIFAWTKVKIPSLTLESFDALNEGRWLDPWRSIQEPNHSVGNQIERCFRRPLNWADKTSEIYADRYRSSFIASYLLGALAVLAAFLGSYKLPSWHNLRPDPPAWFFVELAMISGILLLVALNKWAKWHERWIDYRLLAEGFRQMRALALFARVAPSFEVPPHLSEDNQGPSWFNWYFRASVRYAGLVQAKIDEQYLDVCRKILKREIDEQIEYHHGNEEKFEALHHRLHWLSLVLFFLTLVACLLHLAENFHLAYFSEQAAGLLTLFALVLPAFGAAIQGILHQGEFGRIARRSRSIKNRLSELRNDVKEKKEVTFRDLGRTTESFCKIQIQEQADWRAVFINQEFSL